MQGVFHKHLDDKVRPCIDLIDSLRSFGVEEDLALPAIAVIGDQSSGKRIVTRCPLQLRLRSLRVGEKWKARISYKDTDGIDIHDPSQVEQHIINAQNALAGDGVGICEELITLEISSPDVCDLTLIDLPGIARTKHLISQFIRRNETIILVVVPCNIDIATTEALKMAKEVDPVGKRTLGILTKPDLVDRGTEQTILAVVRNQVIPLRKGYLLVKCRGQRQIDERVSLADVTQMERDFFEQHEFFKYLLREEKATTQCLASKLTEELVDQIKVRLYEDFNKKQCNVTLVDAENQT
ncbi:hypothetical protein JZ751_029130 [Albula glossodonta]|uniref:Dynamin-type G domain-containing protein n=1 Tax=Albula glossodonta TaxID=121402 RepID=A0A8T2P5N1_9TELE|nr:hypothetical protein JZ751_029130 [Albula glossodonta]